MATTPKLNIAQRLNAAQVEVTYVQKEKKAEMKYSIVSHDDVTAKVRPVLVKHGILYYPHAMVMQQVGNRTECQMTVRFENIDDRSDFIDVVTAGYGIDQQDKGPGKAISYSVKYALLKALGLETGDDPDKDQDAKFDDPENPDRMAIDAFLEEIHSAATVEALEKSGKDHAQAMAKARKEFPQQVMEVRKEYSRKIIELKKGASNG